MTTKFRPSDEELVSFVDGELDSELSLAIESALIGNRELQKRVDQFQESRELLLEAFNVTKIETPAHIIAQIEDMESSFNKKIDPKKNGFFLYNFFQSLKIEYAIPAAAFSLGLFLNPVLLPSSDNQTEIDSLTDQLVLRGSMSESYLQLSLDTNIDIKEYLNIRALQDGVEINSGESLKAGREFTILLLSPFNGIASLSEKISDEADEEVASVEISLGRYINFPAMEVTDQSSLSLIVRLKGEEIEISQVLNFDVVY